MAMDVHCRPQFRYIGAVGAPQHIPHLGYSSLVGYVLGSGVPFDPSRDTTMNEREFLGWEEENLYYEMIAAIRSMPLSSESRPQFVTLAGDLRERGQGHEAYMQRRIEADVARKGD
jgi:hypothetical protein